MKLSSFIIFLIIILILVGLYFYISKLNTNNIKYNNYEGFISFQTDVETNTFVKIPQYSQINSVLKLYDNIFFDNTNGNLIEVDGLEKKTNDKNGSTIQNLYVTTRDDPTNVNTYPINGKLDNAKIDESTIKNVSNSYVAFSYQNQSSYASQSVTFYTAWQDLTCINVFSNTNIIDKNNNTPLSSIDLVQSYLAVPGSSPQYSFINTCDFIDTTIPYYEDKDPNNNTFVIEPLYNPNVQVYQITHFVKFDVTTGYLIIINGDRNSDITIYDSNGDVVDMNTPANAIMNSTNTTRSSSGSGIITPPPVKTTPITTDLSPAIVPTTPTNKPSTSGTINITVDEQTVSTALGGLKGLLGNLGGVGGILQLLMGYLKDNNQVNTTAVTNISTAPVNTTSVTNITTTPINTTAVTKTTTTTPTNTTYFTNSTPTADNDILYQCFATLYTLAYYKAFLTSYDITYFLYVYDKVYSYAIKYINPIDLKKNIINAYSKGLNDSLSIIDLNTLKNITPYTLPTYINYDFIVSSLYSFGYINNKNGVDDNSDNGIILDINKFLNLYNIAITYINNNISNPYNYIASSYLDGFNDSYNIFTSQTLPTAGITSGPTAGITSGPTAGITSGPTAGITSGPTAGITSGPTTGITSTPLITKKEPFTSSINSFKPFMLIDMYGQNVVIYNQIDEMDTIVIIGGYSDATNKVFEIINAVRITENGVDTGNSVPSSRPGYNSGFCLNPYKMVNNNDYILKTQVLPAMYNNSCSKCGSSGACTNCGGSGGCGTLSSVGDSVVKTTAIPKIDQGITPTPYVKKSSVLSTKDTPVVNTSSNDFLPILNDFSSFGH